MPRYFFHTEDGSCYPDNNGVELPNLDAVRHTALRTMCEMSQAMGANFWRSGGMRVIVKDADDLTLMTLDVISTMAAAMPSSRSDSSQEASSIAGD